MHEIIATNNAALLSIAIESIGVLDEGVSNAIYSAKDLNGDTAFLKACRLGHDYAIEALFQIATRNNGDIEELTQGWSRVVEKGFAKSAALLMKNAESRGININHGANLEAILERGEHATVEKILGELSLKVGEDRALSGNLLVRYPELMYKIIATNNAKLIAHAIKSTEQISEQDRDFIFNSVNKKGDTPFLHACRLGFDDAIELLFDVSKEAAEEGLQICAELGFADSINTIMKKVRAAEMSVDLSPALLLAIFGNKETAASNLIANGASVNAYAYYAKVEGRDIEPLVLSPLEAAAMADNKILVLELLKNGAHFLDESRKYFDYYAKYRERNPQEDVVLDEIEKLKKDVVLGEIKTLEDDKYIYSELVGEAIKSKVFAHSTGLHAAANQLVSEMDGLGCGYLDRIDGIKRGISAAVLFAKTINDAVLNGRDISLMIGEDIEAIKSGSKEKIDKIHERRSGASESLTRVTSASPLDGGLQQRRGSSGNGENLSSR